MGGRVTISALDMVVMVLAVDRVLGHIRQRVCASSHVPLASDTQAPLEGGRETSGVVRVAAPWF